MFGYWTSTSTHGRVGYAWYVNGIARLTAYPMNIDIINAATGIRPVIEVLKSNL